MAVRATLGFLRFLQGRTMLMKGLEERQRFVVHTGNLSQYTEMMMKRHASSSAELTAAFKRLSKEDHSKLDLSADPISLSQCDLGDVNKADVKSTLKVFLTTFSSSQAESAVLSCLKQLSLDSISQLILQFPAEAEDMEDSQWISEVLKVWAPLEKLVDSGKVHVLGVADTDIDRLKLLCEAADEPPKIDHYSIDGCCTVPQELVEFAKSNDIQLLTHNDARTFVLDESFKEETQKIFGEKVSEFDVDWSARYTIWLRSRSVMAAKGYLVEFAKH